VGIFIGIYGWLWLAGHLNWGNQFIEPELTVMSSGMGCQIFKNIAKGGQPTSDNGLGNESDLPTGLCSARLAYD
jgi:hypothetical protein